ncbi:MAG TPA: hypothetical protein VIF88_03735 [Methylocystis sp.]|jgi:hypothetical protein
MTNYLARLKAIVSEKGIPHELPKLPKAPAELPKPPFGSFGSDRGGHVLKLDVGAKNPGDDLSTPSAAPVVVVLPADARASVDRLLAAMAAENGRRRDWHTKPVEGWREGRLEWRSIVTGERAIIQLPKGRKVSRRPPIDAGG